MVVSLPTDTNTEFERRYRMTLNVNGLVTTAILALVALSFFVENSTTYAADPTLVYGLWIAMVGAALGIVVYRRAKFSAMRLQAVADARGTTGLIASLQHTTVIIALVCLAITVMGFVITFLLGDLYPSWWRAGVVRGAFISALLLFACYPRRKAWQQTVASFIPATQAATKGFAG